MKGGSSLLIYVVNTFKLSSDLPAVLRSEVSICLVRANFASQPLAQVCAQRN